jgi:integrase
MLVWDVGAKQSLSITDKECRQKGTGKRKKLSDGRGLQLWLQPNCTPKSGRLWRFAYRFGGKQKLLALGAFPDVSLEQARTSTAKARAILRGGADPSLVRKQAKSAAAEGSATFQAVAEEYIAKKTREGRASSTLTKLQWMLGFAYPTLGYREINAIRPIDVLPVLQAIEARGRIETARRLREVIGCVFRYAMSTARAEIDPTVALRGALAEYKPKPRAAITTPKEFGALLRAIDGFEGQPTTAAALKLMARLFPRPGEMRQAEWPEFDLEAAVWTIPAPHLKVKDRGPHRVPLSRQALTIIRKLQPITGRGRLVFPSVRTTAKPLSETTLNAALRRMGYGPDEATAHGFRASASTLLNECGLWGADAIERQLAHIEANNVRRAYARGEHWDERIRMMQWWADYLDELMQSKPAASAGDAKQPTAPTFTAE